MEVGKRVSILALKLSLNTLLGPLDLYQKDWILGIKHQRENLETSTPTVAINGSNNSDDGDDNNNNDTYWTHIAYQILR